MIVKSTTTPCPFFRKHPVNFDTSFRPSRPVWTQAPRPKKLNWKC